MKLLYDPAIPLLGIYPKKMKTTTQKDICTLMFIATLFINSQDRKKPKHPSMDKQIKKLRYTCTMEYYSAIEKKEILPFETA